VTLSVVKLVAITLYWCKIQKVLFHEHLYRYSSTRFSIDKEFKSITKKEDKELKNPNKKSRRR
jgi:hypothetical protein